MQIIPISAFTDNYIWLIVNNSEAFCIDPGEAKPVISYLDEHALKLSGILLTHHHFDHVGGVKDLLNFAPASKVYGPHDKRIVGITDYLAGGTELTIIPYKFKVLNTPGHTSTHISFYESQFGWLFCGDTLFSAGCGRVFDGTFAELFNSLNIFKSLPNQTKIYCAHEYTKHNLCFAATIEPKNKDIQVHIANLTICSLPSTIGLEKKINPFLRTDLPSLQEHALQNDAKDLSSFAIFKQIRKEKDCFA